MYSKLFEKQNIGQLEIKNRFVVPAMDSHYTNEENYFTNQALNYYGERAKGGFGLIITEFLCVSPEGLAEKTQAGIYDDKFIPMLSRLVERVHSYDAKIFAQIQHSGRQKGNDIDAQAVGASALVAMGKKGTVHELTTQEVKVIEQKFIDAAVRAKKAGFDGVEIHGAHGYLLAQFLSKATNKRVDEYGGNITNRARIVCEIIQGVKEACGKDYPVIVRTSGYEGFYGGNDIEDAIAQSILFEKMGADALHISYGTPIESYYTKAGFNMDNIRKVKSAVNIPVIGVGRINDPTLALSMLETHTADFVALGRQSICDPHFPQKVKEGRLNEIFTCTGCMQRCLYTHMFEPGCGTSCMINPFSGKEGLWEIEDCQTPKKIVVVGAGPAGLQASWILAKKGHDVTLYEQENTPGGQYRLACIPTMKQDLAKTISTYVALCQKYGVKMELGKTVTQDMLDQCEADEIIIAVGSKPIVPRSIPGIDTNKQVLANDVLASRAVIQNQRVLVLGAGLVGVETAEFLAEQGNQVTIMDMIDKAAPLAPNRPRLMLLKHCKELGIEFMLESKVVEITDDGVRYEHQGNTQNVQGFDQIVLAFGSMPFRDLTSSNEHVHFIGDASQAGDAKKAIFEATELALKL